MSKAVSRRRLAGFIAQQMLDAPTQRKKWLRLLAAHLLETRRTDQTHLYINDIATEFEERASLLSLEVDSARKLTPAMRDSIIKDLRKLTGAKTVSLHEKVNPELVGGFVARTPEGELDASLEHGLRKLASIA